MYSTLSRFFFFFFNDTATTEIYTLSLHDALPSWPLSSTASTARFSSSPIIGCATAMRGSLATRSEEHTSELQSQFHLVCRLLLEKKKKKLNFIIIYKKKKKSKKN